MASDLCSVCAGSSPVSGLPCICGGSGDIGGQIIGLTREAIECRDECERLRSLLDYANKEIYRLVMVLNSGGSPMEGTTFSDEFNILLVESYGFIARLEIEAGREDQAYFYATQAAHWANKTV